MSTKRSHTLQFIGDHQESTHQLFALWNDLATRYDVALCTLISQIYSERQIDAIQVGPENRVARRCVGELRALSVSIYATFQFAHWRKNQ